ncbi:MAG TPA: DUF4188 domain-containing protein [Pseudonocardia sp.]|nr:DUF4188 domain-containing protein [Pseudonocardia sp.]
MLGHFQSAVLRIEPSAIPTLRAAFDDALGELRPHLRRLRQEAYIREPWLGDQTSAEVAHHYNLRVMDSDDGPYAAMMALEAELLRIRDSLKVMEDHYRRTEGDKRRTVGSAVEPVTRSVPRRGRQPCERSAERESDRKAAACSGGAPTAGVSGGPTALRGTAGPTGVPAPVTSVRRAPSSRRPLAPVNGERAMREIHRGRHIAEIDGDFVVLLIGARFSLLHPVRTFRDLGGSKHGMKAMLDHLVASPEKGLLGYTFGYPLIVQYWRSFDHLEAFARDESDLHTIAWREYYRRDKRHRGAGVWHETYLVHAGEYEAIYGNMPPFGLGAASRLVPAAESSTGWLRVRSRDRA